MYGKVSSGVLVFLFFSILMLHRGTEAQLNFSTGWGKRSHNLIKMDTTTSNCFRPGKPSFQHLLDIYNLIQIEAERILDCRKLNE